MYLTKPLSKMFNNLLKFDKLLSMMPYTCWSKKKGKKRKDKNTFFSYLPHLKSEKLYIFIIILIMVAEIYNLSKNSSLSEYAVVYSKLSKV